MIKGKRGKYNLTCVKLYLAIDFRIQWSATKAMHEHNRE